MPISAQEKKLLAARSALDYLHEDMIVGVGTGSTVNALIELLGAHRHRPRAAVSSSENSAARLRAAGIPIVDLNGVDSLPLYIDGADEANRDRMLIKGGGAALTREKIVAAVAERFVCIIDDSKLVEVLGTFPLPVEVIPMARNHVARQLTRLGGRPVWRENTPNDNGNEILDVHGLVISDPVGLEAVINQIAGVVSVGLFAARPADVLIIAGDQGTRTLRA